MKKIIIPFDGGTFSEGAFSFVANLNRTSPVLLTGIFLPQTNFANFFLFPPHLPKPASLEKDTEEENIRKNIQRFISLCKTNNIEYKIHEDLADFAIPELTKETRFSDLLIIESKSFLRNIPGNNSSMFLLDALQHTECPVLIIPEKSYFPACNILAYDGSASSVFAIKQFSYIFPELCSNKTILAYTTDETEDLPGGINIEELIAIHFSNMAVTVLKTDSKMNFNSWILKHENPLLVSGSFSRPGFSSLFTKNFVTNIINARQAFVFIAHP